MDSLLQSLENVDFETEELLSENSWNVLESLILDTHIPEMKIGVERPCVKKDFEQFLQNIEHNLNYLKSFMSKVYSWRTKYVGRNVKLKKNIMVILISMCGEHMGEHAWSSDVCNSHATSILDIICSIYDFNNVKHIFVREKSENTDMDAMLKPILLSLRPKLLKESWKAYPAAVACFIWLLSHVKSPHLSDHLNSVLPTALILVDDFIPENRLLGVKCVHHIVDNVPRTQLCWYGQAEVIYEALFKDVYHRDILLVTPVLDCLTIVVDKLESGPDAEDRKFEWTRRDDVLQLLLRQMELEQQLALRNAYVEALLPLMRPLGLALARHARALTRVLAAYLEAALYDDPRVTLHALKSVHILCEQCGPRMPTHAPRLAAALLRLLADVHDNGPTPAPAAMAALAVPAADALRALLATAPAVAAELASTLRPAPPEATLGLATALEGVLAPFVEYSKVLEPTTALKSGSIVNPQA